MDEGETKESFADVARDSAVAAGCSLTLTPCTLHSVSADGAVAVSGDAMRTADRNKRTVAVAAGGDDAILTKVEKTTTKMEQSHSGHLASPRSPSAASMPAQRTGLAWAI